MTDKEYLLAVKALIQDPKHWIKGQEHYIESNGLHRFCMVGAIRRVYFTNDDARQSNLDRVTEALENSVDYLSDNGRSLFKFNDDDRTNHEMVMKAFDLALEEV